MRYPTHLAKCYFKLNIEVLFGFEQLPLSCRNRIKLPYQELQIGVIVPGNRKKKRQKKHEAQPGLLSRRTDMDTRLLVEIGIQYAPTLGVSKAAELLRKRAVPEDVIERVLHRPPKPTKI